MQRYGITVPFDGVPLAAQRELFAELPDLGYTDVDRKSTRLNSSHS